MSDDAMDELWLLFGAEYEEYLATAETILATPGAAGDRIDELFRAFHSIKGGAAALSLRSIEKVAHAAEDVLHRVRNGDLPLSAPVEEVMLAALSELRELETAALGARTDRPVNATLVARLHEFLARSSPPPKGTAQKESAAAPAAAPAATSRDIATVDPGSQGGPAEGVDLTLLQDPVLSLAGAMDEDPGPAASALALMAEALDLHGLAAAAARLSAAEVPAATVDRWRLLDVIERLHALEAGAGANIGAMALIGAAEPALATLLQEVAAELKTTPLDAACWSRAWRLLAVLDMGELAQLADLAGSRILGGQSDVQFAEIADLIALTGILMEAGVGPPQEEVSLLWMAEARRCGIPIDVASDTPEAEGLPPTALQGLSAEGREALAAAVAKGLSLYLVDVDLETEPAVADTVMELLRRRTVISSRSALDLGPGRFAVLVASDDTPEALAAALLDADPERGVVKALHRSDGAERQGTDLLPPVRPPPAATAAPGPTPPRGPDGPAPAAAPGRPGGRSGDGIVRVPSSAIDGLMDRIGELRLGATGLTLSIERFTSSRARQRLDGLVAQATGRQRDELMAVAASLAELQQGLADGWSQVDGGIRRLYQSTTALRVVPVGTLFNRLLRPIRETAAAVGKEVVLTTLGEDVQVDKSTIELLVDPLTHVVRNAIDHGIETPDVRRANNKPAAGSLVVRARQTTHSAIIEVEDDGAGIAVERVREKAVAKGLVPAATAAAMPASEVMELIFAPGFSTREVVTETSGRGVGMDIVATTVRKKLGGTLRIDSRQGQGTLLVLEFPISAAIQRVLTVRAGGQAVALLERAVSEIVTVAPDRIQRVGGRRGCFLRDRFLPIADLAAAVGWGTAALPTKGSEPEEAPETVVVIGDGRRRLGLSVDQVVGRQEVFFKRLHPLLERNRLLAGIAVVGAGSLLFALDAEALVDAAMVAES